MPIHPIKDWDDAYANMPNIPAGESYPQRWATAAADFRAQMEEAGRSELDIAYGERERQKYDLFLPPNSPAGVAIFVHGGYWMRFDKSSFSHLAAGPLARGHAVAMPAYSLCPNATIGEIGREVVQAIGAIASRFDGPVRLIGHSAGGHLVTRAVCSDSRLSPDVVARIVHVMSVSGVHDLRPLLRLELNQVLRLDLAQARAESPALMEPLDALRVTCWAGAGERSEFVRQNALLANVWRGLGAAIERVEEPDRHHFDVVDALTDPQSPMVRRFFDEH